VITTIIHSYIARLIFIVAAIAAAVVIIGFRIVFKGGLSSIRPNNPAKI